MPATLDEAVKAVRHYAPQSRPKIAIILGSGLATVADEVEHPITIPYQAIPGLQVSNVAGHPSLLIMGKMSGVPVAFLKGRLHLYEGIPYQSISILIRLIKQLGCEILIVTGASGSLNEAMVPGDLVALNDHINFLGGNPLIGPNDETLGPRFVSLENAYDSDLRESLMAVGGRT